MPSATAQLGSSGEGTQHPDNGRGCRGLALKLSLGKLTAQLTWRSTMILIQEFPQKEMGLMSHCGPSSLTDPVILWLPIFLGMPLQRWPVSLSPQAAGEEQSVGTPRSRECVAEAGNPLCPPPFLPSSGDVTHRDIPSQHNPPLAKPSHSSDNAVRKQSWLIFLPCNLTSSTEYNTLLPTPVPRAKQS